MNTLAVLGKFSCSYIVVFLFFGGGRASLNPLQGMSAEPKPVWVRQLRKDCIRQHTCHSSRIDYFIACSLRSCLGRCLLISSYPQVQSIKIDAFLSSARSPKQNTIRVMVVHGISLLSCRIKIVGDICDRQCFVDWHILCVVQEF